MIIRVLIIFILLFVESNVSANTNFFKEGVNLFNENKLKEAKFKFEQDIVYNLKNEKSYLYLSKIFKNFEKQDLVEQNLKTVILLNPKNEEAIYNLAKLKLEASDYKKQELNKKLMTICDKFCEKSKNLKTEIETLSKK